jgi:hypothetical protein
MAHFMRIAMVALALVAVLVFMRPCSEGISRFVTSFSAGSDAGAGPAQPTPTLNFDGGHFVEIKPGMSDEQIRRILSDAGP